MSKPCERMVREFVAYDNRGQAIYRQRKCGLDGEEIELQGVSYSAKATLCPPHKAEAEYEVQHTNAANQKEIEKRRKLEKAGQAKLFEPVEETVQSVENS